MNCILAYSCMHITYFDHSPSIVSFPKSVWTFPEKPKIELPFDPAIPLLSIFLKELKSAYYRDICIHIYCSKAIETALVPIHIRIDKENVVYCIYMIEYYSGIKKSKTESFVGRGMELETTMLREIIAVAFSVVWKEWPGFTYTGFCHYRQYTRTWYNQCLKTLQ